MGVRGVVCVIVLTGLAFLAPSEAVRAGCSANLAWQDRYPVWVGSTIAFQRESVGCSVPDVVALVRSDGTGLRTVGTGVSPTLSSSGNLVWTNEFNRLIVDGADVTGGEWPSWSPNGDRAAFLRGEGLWVRDMRSGVERRLADVAIFVPFSEAHVTTPSWSPDGRAIAFVGRGMKISVARADGSDVRRLTSGLDRQVSPVWSPDGVRIAFASDRAGNFDIWSIRPDGSGTARLTSDEADETLPAWAPDGQRIAFLEAVGNGYGKATLHVMGGEGGFERSVGTDAHGFSQPAWSPDGSRIVFSSGRECLRWGLYVVSLTSSREERITNRCRFVGTAKADVLRGTPFLDFLSGGSGDDILRGLAGADSLTGGMGVDVLEGGGGADTINARDGRRDVVRGGPGRDSARVDRGLDRVSGVERMLR